MQSLFLRTATSRAQPLIRRVSRIAASIQTPNLFSRTIPACSFSSDSHSDFAPKRKFIDDVDEAVKVIKVLIVYFPILLCLYDIFSRLWFHLLINFKSVSRRK